MNFKETIRGNKWILLVFMAYLIVGLLLIFLFDKGHWVLWFAGNRTAFSDIFFTYATLLGDGWVIGGMTAVYLLIRFRYWHFLILSVLIPVGVTLLLKFEIYSQSLRPIEYFSRQGIDFSLVPGVTVHHFNSFPSGHTTVGFAFFTGLLLIVKPQWLKIIFLILAVIIGISRIYLSQHFLEDVIMGGLIGFCIPVVLHGMVSGKEWFASGKLTGLRKKTH